MFYCIIIRSCESIFLICVRCGVNSTSAENGHVTDLRFVSILVDTNLIRIIYETGMKWICAKYVVLGSTENGGDKKLLNNFQMPNRN